MMKLSGDKWPEGDMKPRPPFFKPVDNPVGSPSRFEPEGKPIPLFDPDTSGDDPL